jgi:hypothetical protein
LSMVQETQPEVNDNGRGATHLSLSGNLD